MKTPQKYERLGVKLTYRSLDPQWLCNDRIHYQRDISQERVQKVLKRPEKGRPAILVSYHPMDDTYWIIDGQHHNEAALRADEDLIDCWVFMSTGWMKDSEIFDKFQEG